jgi:hypothetical protein
MGVLVLFRKFILKLYAYNYFSNSCVNSKRIYIKNEFSWDCPKCEETVISSFDLVPFISYGSYCHVYFCKICQFESKEKMYTLNSIGIDFVDVSLSLDYNLKII